MWVQTLALVMIAVGAGIIGWGVRDLQIVRRWGVKDLDIRR